MPLEFTHRVRRGIVFLIAILLFSTTPAMAGFLYVLNVQSGASARIYGYNADPETGALSALAGFPVATGAVGNGALLHETMAVDSRNARLYVVNDGPNTLSIFSIDPATGALAEMPYSPVQLTAAQWATVAVHPSGSPVVVGGLLTSTAGIAESFNISDAGIAAAAGSPFGLGRATAFSSEFSADGSYYYAGGLALTTYMSGHSVDASTGVLTPLAGSPFNVVGARPRGFAAHPDGRFFLVDNGSKMRVFTTESGVPSGVAGNPFDAVSGSVNTVVHPDGGYIMVVGNIAEHVTAYQIAGSGPSTVPIPVSTAPAGGSSASMLAMGRSGRVVYAGNAISRNVATMGFDASTGVLTLLAVQPASSQGNAGALAGIALYEEPMVVNPPVAEPADMIRAMLATLNGYDPPLPKGMLRSFVAKLENALKDLEAGDIGGAVDKLNAFINHVRAQNRKALSPERAEELTSAAEAAIAALETEDTMIFGQ